MTDAEVALLVYNSANEELITFSSHGREASFRRWRDKEEEGDNLELGDYEERFGEAALGVGIKKKEKKKKKTPKEKKRKRRKGEEEDDEEEEEEEEQSEQRQQHKVKIKLSDSGPSFQPAADHEAAAWKPNQKVRSAYAEEPQAMAGEMPAAPSPVQGATVVSKRDRKRKKKKNKSGNAGLGGFQLDTELPLQAATTTGFTPTSAAGSFTAQAFSPGFVSDLGISTPQLFQGSLWGNQGLSPSAPNLFSPTGMLSNPFAK